jgi:hypothetical protein
MKRLAQIAAIRAHERVFDVSGREHGPQVFDTSFDAIVCLIEAASLPRVRSALANWRRTLRPGGRVGLGLYGSTDPNDPENCRDAFREAGFADIHVRTHFERVPMEAEEPEHARVIYAVAWERPR